jgi:hypothetical protein
MGIFDRISRAVGRDLDARVAGSDGSAEVRHEVGGDESRWSVTTALQGGQGSIATTGPAGGLGRDLRGQTFTAEADVTGSGLAVLTAVLVDDQQNRETYSVEARPDDQGRAHLRLVVRYG